MLKYNLRNIDEMKNCGAIIENFEKKFEITLPPLYKVFLEKFDILGNNDLDYYDNNTFLNNNFTYNRGLFWNINFDGTGNGFTELWDTTKYFAQCIASDELIIAFDDQFEYLEKDFFSIGNYDNYNFYYVGIKEYNFDKIFYMDRDLHTEPKFICNNIFEFLSYFKAEYECDNNFSKKLGERYFVKKEPFKIKPSVIEELKANCFEPENSYIEFDYKLNNNSSSLKSDFNIVMNKINYKKIRAKFDTRISKIPVNLNIYSENNLNKHLSEICHELRYRPYQFPVVFDEIRVAKINGFLGVNYFYTIENNTVKILNVYDFYELLPESN